MPQAIASAVGYFLFTAGASLAVVNAVTFATVYLVQAAIAVGVNLALNRILAPSAGQTPELKPQDIQQAIRQPVPPRVRSYGDVLIGGFVFWRDAVTSTGKLYLGQIVNHGEVEDFLQYYIDNNAVALDGAGAVQTAPYNTVSTTILSRLGVDDETAYSELSTAFGYNEVRGDGVATILGIFEDFTTAEAQQTNYPNGLPQLKVLMRASKVWDWRDAAQLRDDRTTWLSSKNPVVCAMDYLMHADGFAIPYERFAANIAEWTREADICDEEVIGLGGVGMEPRFQLSMTYDYQQRPGDVLNQILRAADARVWPRSDGTIGIRVNHFRRPSKTLDGRHIVGYKVRRGQDRLTSIAGVRAKFLDTSNGYVETEAEPWPSMEAVLQLGEDRVVTLPLQMVPSGGQARRLAELAYLAATAPTKLTLYTNLAGCRAIDERWLHVVIPERGIDADYEINDFTLDVMTGRCQLELTEHVDVAAAETPANTIALRGTGQTVRDTYVTDPVTVSFTALEGDDPQAGDLVVVQITIVDDAALTTPSGWTLVGNTDTGFERYAYYAKIIDAGDLAGSVAFSGTLLISTSYVSQWAAFHGFAGSTIAASGYSTSAENSGDPVAVVLDMTSVVGPAIAFAGFGSQNSSGLELGSSKFIGQQSDGTISAAMFDGGGTKDYHIIQLRWKFIDDGEAGLSLSADMDDEGNLNVISVFGIDVN